MKVKVGKFSSLRAALKNLSISPVRKQLFFRTAYLYLAVLTNIYPVEQRKLYNHPTSLQLSLVFRSNIKHTYCTSLKCHCVERFARKNEGEQRNSNREEKRRNYSAYYRKRTTTWIIPCRLFILL